MKKPSIVFFGTGEYSVITLETLFKNNISPTLVVSTPDKPQGRGLKLTPTPVKVWAENHNIPVVQPDKLKDPEFLEVLKNTDSDVFVVVAYGKIIPDAVLNIPKSGALNIHASLLPKFRGASPIESAILADEKENGVTIMKIDSEMDHGPIVAQEKITLSTWPVAREEFGNLLVRTGSELLAKILPDWIAGKIKPIEQNHTEATYTKKIQKTDGLIDLNDDPYKNWLKISAYDEWPGTYFFVERNGKKIRVNIKKTKYENNKLEILSVVPEGKKETKYQDFMRSL